MKLKKISWKKIPVTMRATLIGGLFMLLAAVVTVVGNYIMTLGHQKDSKSENAFPSTTIVFSNRLEINANEIAMDVGTVSKVVKGIDKKTVVVFEENHFSRRGQIEIAIMLNRLYEKYGLRHIGLEGSFEAEGTLDATWYHPSLDADQVLSPKEKIAVQLLAEGEISSSEMLSLIYPDIEVHGIEKAAEYNMDISEGAFAAINVYLIAIAEKALTQSQVIEINRLINENKAQDALELLLNADPFTKHQHQLLTQADKILSAEERQDIVKRIKAKAEEVNATLASGYKRNMDDVLEFYTRASRRSETMSANLVELSTKFPETPVAIIMGAAHTEKVSRLLAESGISHIILTPISLRNQQSVADKLSEEAFIRNLRGLSVDETYGVGALLDGRAKKPHPKLHKTWLRSKVEIYYLTALVAYTDSRDDPLLSSYISNVLTKMQYITPIPNSFQIIGNEIIFAVKAQVEDLSKPLKIWIRTSFVRDTSLLKLENALKNQLVRFESHNWQNSSTKLRAINVTIDVLALFSTNLSNLQKISVL